VFKKFFVLIPVSVRVNSWSVSWILWLYFIISIMWTSINQNINVDVYCIYVQNPEYFQIIVVSVASLRVYHHLILTSSLESCYNLFSAYDGNQDTQICFCSVACSAYGIYSELLVKAHKIVTLSRQSYSRKVLYVQQDIWCGDFGSHCTK
jgi:hypothetical protein